MFWHIDFEGGIHSTMGSLQVGMEVFDSMKYRNLSMDTASAVGYRIRERNLRIDREVMAEFDLSWAEHSIQQPYV